ncbi:GNAT family N-acetyltransferase [Roseovarius nanhaiticus]|uniref:Putative acetyltransferase n=1 Tax=Roseovarius nanhaiticus TaxID=573024 RepID=A0A1N7H323_9RHOB|nr:GNAT family N-acetyltransferase [Roseovarius nanhaiticus]SEL15016.1 putative acetyltransferase [Roseovarius nanhaiticus]SIS19160.1 putative acetyltransferase [Roseovarius nanhaiticus]
MILRFPEFSRDLRRGEEPAVDALLLAAFGDAAQLARIAALRRAGDIAGEVVLPYRDEIVGYYALATMCAPKGWLCLAAVAIAPDWQGAGHGRRLMGVLSEWARLSGQTVIAEGPPPFFERAGFAPAGGRLALAGPTPPDDMPGLVYPAALVHRA